MIGVEQRKFQTRVIILKNKIQQPKFIFKVILTIFLIVVGLPFVLYLIIYTGYSQKLINSTDQIRDEISTGVLISDSNKDNIKTLTDSVKEAFQKRKISLIYIYLLGDSQSLSDDSIKALLDKVPSDEIKIDRTTESPYEVCDSAKNVYNLSKFVTLSFKDIAIRASYICNNLGMFTQSYSPKINEKSLNVTESSFKDYLNDINKTLLGVSFKF